VTPPKEKAAAKPDPATEAEELEKEIEETRRELGDTVEQLTRKADVKGRAQAKVDEARDDLTPVAGIAAGVAALLVLLWLIRRR
jgi:hypothetical protein